MQRKIYTIGYEGTDLENFVATLNKAKVKILIDVRAVPLSRKPGFSKNKLAERLAKDDIRYLGLKALGTPASGRDAARKGRIAEMKEIFSKHLESTEAIKAMEDVIQVASRTSSCLLCFEHAPSCCHRSVVADRISERAGLKIEHLNPIVSGLL